jgi:hypothetical protein
MAYDICPQDAAKASHTNDSADVEAGTNRYEMARVSSAKLRYMDKDEFLNEVSPFAFRLFIGDVPKVRSSSVLLTSCGKVQSVKSELQRFNDNVTLLSKLQDQSLNSIGDSNIQDQIDRAIQETKPMMNSLRDQIKSLQAQGGNNDNNKFRREHVSINGIVKS